MGQHLHFNILGPLDVVVDNRSVPIPVGKQRILLAALLLKANEIVPVDELIERLWGQDLPCRPRSALHTYLTRLRHTLSELCPGRAIRIHTSAAGYLLEVGAHDLDLIRFRQLLARARCAADDNDRIRESTALTEALSLWRGPVLPDVRSDSLHRDVVPEITEDWLRALDRFFELRLALGQFDDLVGPLRVVTQKYPFHERLWQRFMLVLHRCGRRAEALAAYAELSDNMRAELGVDPSPELRQLHVSMLRGEADSEYALSAR
ncbi:AfsR/SARP family transcriptional regulator [Kutzneria sp. CA-103260]|uniref:AfsR/SARP family transcriptional regulator n=1 Tax=Kutzneria sp. CA-103260 TaxID=2802641 RepID=UPI001BACF2BF|nr:AfsR/SARP family transcriptional regulator [Kutzneria sp. CA-103260]QUQ63725.1 SARP family transcriptional regulator [Kutzneria sp. CA-103260]